MVGFLVAHLAFISAICLGVAFDSRHELPHRHRVDLLRRESHRGAGAVNRAKSKLAVRQVVYLTSA